MAAFGGGVQGVDGVKALAAAGGFVVIFIFVLQLISFVKIFFVDVQAEEISEEDLVPESSEDASELSSI